MKQPIVSICMGSDSDLPVMQEAAEILEQFEVPYEITIVSAHRTAQRLYDYATTASEKSLQVIIAGAGGAAHLPGMVASMTSLPVIGVPIKTSTLNGVDSLYSIVQMPGGVPVASVAINGAKNAGLLAVRMLGASNPEIRTKMVAYQKELESSVLSKAEKLEEIGYSKYLQGRS